MAPAPVGPASRSAGGGGAGQNFLQAYSCFRPCWASAGSYMNRSKLLGDMQLEQMREYP